MSLPGRRLARWTTRWITRRGPLACAVTAGALATVLAALLAPGAAHALDDEREGVPRVAAPDQLGGQLIVRGGAEIVGPVGNLSEDVAVDDVAATGIGAFASVGLGISRTTEVVLSGGYAVLSDPSRCDCGGDTARIGLGLAYHLAQGSALDPWARWGVGFRTTSIEGDGATSRVARELRPGRHHGLDLTQLALGATWSPVPGFGFGPYAEMDLGTYLVRPEGGGAGGFHGFFTFGLALQVTPGRSSTVPAGSAATAPPAF